MSSIDVLLFDLGGVLIEFSGVQGLAALLQRVAIGLATVVIGGILSSTALTLLVLPVLYRLAHRKDEDETVQPDRTGGAARPYSA